MPVTGTSASLERALLRGSWVVISGVYGGPLRVLQCPWVVVSGVISPLIRVISVVTLLITPPPL